ncbi:AAA family ATPase [Clostridium sp. MF28]|uniref:AAA family ATPase n=1 Tax=Clostridium TaxID=1485 RepID=UPI000CFA25AB|nr:MULTISPECIES: AAA family ATPase [Clostridium]AVK51413.1 AAA family ATPase [Clostridium sp. MF28]PSM58497.1 AAA family ATPase [Clostridium diolis]
MKKKLPIGIDDFKTLIENNYYFVDKSLLIKEFINNSANIILTPRPRRFGKTLNMSMIKYFFDINTKDESGTLFDELNIKKDKQIMELQGKQPVIFITLKDTKFANFRDFTSAIRGLMSEVYKEYIYVLDSDNLLDADKEDFNKILYSKGDIPLLTNSIKNLSRYLCKYHDKKVILLIDEYDVPIQEAYINGYYDEVILFMRNLLGSVLKGNLYIEKALLTGILRVAKESIFSGLNNLEVDTIIRNKFSDKFGFLESEIDEILSYYENNNVNIDKNMIKEWYNGYIFGNNIIYNPWSVLNYIDNREEGFKPYWINSSENALVKKILSNGNEEIKKEFEYLIENKTIEKVIDDNVVMGEIEGSSESVWSFLLMTGYLKAVKKENIEGILKCDLAIPNKEVYIYFKNMILKWFDDSLSMLKYKTMLNALVNGDIRNFGALFKGFVINNVSYFDVSGKEPEKVYHAFVLGMLVSLSDNYEVKSNKESGYGRYDVMIIPKDASKYGIVIEFKKIDEFLSDTIEEATKEALEQIENKKYAQELLSRGINNIIKLAIVFKNKEVEITQGS